MSAADGEAKPIRDRSTIRDLLTVVSGTAGAQAIGLLILPVLARTFSPEMFGAFQIYLSMLIFCSIAIALRIELTLLSKGDDETPQTLASLFGLVLVVSTILTLVLTLYDAIGTGLGFPAIFLGLGLVGNGFSQVVSYKLIRDQGFSWLVLLKVSQVGVYAAVALLIAVSHPTLWGLIIADVAGRLASGVVAMRAVGGSEAGAIRIRGLAPFVRRHWELAVISLPGALANSAGTMMTPFMIFHVFGPAAAGQYGLVDRAIGVPVAMIVNAGSQVFAGRIAALILSGNRDGVRRLLLRVVIAGMVVCGIGATIAYALIPFAFAFAFGDGWSPAIRVGRILIFSYAITLVIGIVNQTLVSLGAYRLQSVWDVSWPISIGGVWIAVILLRLDFYAAVTLHAVLMGGIRLVFMLLCLVSLRRGGVSAGTAGA